MNWSETFLIVHNKKKHSISKLPVKVYFRKYRGRIGHNLGILRNLSEKRVDSSIEYGKKQVIQRFPECVCFSIHHSFGIKYFKMKAFPLENNNAWNTFVISLIPWDIERLLWLSCYKGLKNNIHLDEQVVRNILSFLTFDPLVEFRKKNNKLECDFLFL